MLINNCITFQSERYKFDYLCQIKLCQMYSVGSTIRENRKSKNLLLRQLAAILDIDVAILSKIERGERTPTKDQLIKIAIALEIDVNILLKNQLAEKILIELSENINPIEVMKIVQKELKRKI